MSWRRVVPAAVLAPLLLWAATLAPIPTYVIALSLLACVGSAEIYRLLRRAEQRPAWPIGLALAVALALAPGLAPALVPHAVALAMAAALVWAAFRRERAGALVDWALTLAPALYVGGLLGYYLLLRLLPDGAVWVQVVLCCTWAADIAAYAIGSRWGRTRLAPALSPGKSVEGACAGVAAAMLGAITLGLALPSLGRSALFMAGLGLCVGVSGLVGDLAESFIKRQLGAKDSGGLLLGHGGLLDRLDSLLAAGMVAYLYLLAVGG